MAHPAPSRGERAAAPASQQSRESEAVRRWPGLPRPSPKPGPPIRFAPGKPSAPRQKHPNPCQRASAFDEPIGLAKPPEARATSTNHELRTTNQPSSRQPTKSNKPLPTPRYNNAMLILILALWLETHSPTPLAAISAAKEKATYALPATPAKHLETPATWQKIAIQPPRSIVPKPASETPWPATRQPHQTNAQASKPALRGPPPTESTRTNETPDVYARFKLDSPVAPNKGAYPTKVANGRTYELRPSNGGSGPNRWHRVKPVKNVGSQNHHLVSNPIVKALEKAGLSRETALAIRNNPALQKMSAPGGHVGYEKWHINYDRHMVEWIGEAGRDLRITDFFDEINRYYQSGEAARRIPGVNLGVPQ